MEQVEKPTKKISLVLPSLKQCILSLLRSRTQFKKHCSIEYIIKNQVIWMIVEILNTTNNIIIPTRYDSSYKS